VAVQSNGALLADRYRVVRRLGSGGAATVLLCEDQRLGRLVAVKRLHTGSPEDMARRLHREARLGASLNHPNLVSVFDTETYDEGVLIVMEYVEGETLGDALRRGPLPMRQALEVIRALAAALDHAHSHGVVHRDVKPGNVLLGSAGVVKLADLGIGIAADNTRITRTGIALGTPAYMAPEQIEAGRVTPAADVYSLGTLSFELLSGRKAHEGANPLEVAQRAIGRPPPDLRDAWPDAPRAATQALQRAMSRDPQARQQSAGQLRDELDAALAPATPAERPPLSPVGVKLPLGGSRGFPRWIPVLAIVAVAVVAVLALTMGGGSDNSPSRKASTTQARRSQPRTQSTPSKPAPTQSTPAPAPTPSGADEGRRLNDQGKALIDGGGPEQAIPILQQAVNAFPPDTRLSDVNYAYALFNLADAYLRSGQPAQAIPLLQQRLQIPNQTNVVRHELRDALRAAGFKGNGKARAGGD
jgi:eukaryotic-like serine/threonine-protein kinase